MVAVKAAGKVFSVEFSEGMTASQLVDALLTENHVEIRGGWTLIDSASLGRTVSSDETLIDGRYYVLNAWLFAHPVFT